MVRLRYCEAKTFGISDLVIDRDTLASRLSQLEVFLRGHGHPFSETMEESMRECHVRHIIRDMVDVGGIVEGTSEFRLIEEFYLRNFGINGYSYVVYDVTLHRNYPNNSKI